jgi:hypothetical protein
MLGFEFETNSDPFAIYTLVQGVAVFIFQTLQSNIDFKNQNNLIVYTYVSNSFGLVCLISCYFFDFTLEKKRVGTPINLDLNARHDKSTILEENSLLEQQKRILINSISKIQEQVNT